MASPLYSEAARFLKKDWVVKQKSLNKFESDQVKALDQRYANGLGPHVNLKKEIELRALRKNIEGRLLGQ